MAHHERDATAASAGSDLDVVSRIVVERHPQPRLIKYVERPRFLVAVARGTSEELQVAEWRSAVDGQDLVVPREVHERYRTALISDVLQPRSPCPAAWQRLARLGRPAGRVPRRVRGVAEREQLG